MIFLSQPIILITLLGLTAFNQPKNLQISVFNQELNSYSQRIVNSISGEENLKIEKLNTEQEVRDRLKNDKSRLGVLVNVSKNGTVIGGSIEVIENATVPEISGSAKAMVLKSVKETLADFSIENAQLQVKNEGANLTKTTELQTKNKILKLNSEIQSLPLPMDNVASIQKSIQEMATAASFNLGSFKIENKSVLVTETKNTKQDIKYFDFYASSVIILLIIMIGLNTSSTTITQERIDGTFERFFVTPFTKSQMILGKMITFSFVSIALSLITIFSLTALFKVSMGSIWLVLLIAYLSSLVAISLGMFISSVTRTIAESIQVGMLFFFASLITTTFIFQHETMHPIIQYASKAIPFTYAIGAMREVNILNFDISQIWPQLVILIAFTFLFLLLSVLSLKRKAE